MTAVLDLGVMLSHLNLVAEIFIPTAQAREWVVKNAPDQPPAELRTLAHLPVAHIAGVLGYLISPVWTGCACYVGDLLELANLHSELQS
jgi:4-coumarate--CoA ligase